MKISCLLIVEDNDIELDKIEGSIEESNLFIDAIILAKNIESAIFIINHNFVDVVILDIDLQNSVSVDSIKRLRNISKHSTIIVLSRNDDELLGVSAIKAGADDFLVKSKITPDSIRSAIIYAIARREALNKAIKIEKNINRLGRLVS